MDPELEKKFVPEVDRYLSRYKRDTDLAPFVSTPDWIAHLIEPYIRDKAVFDYGAGDGSFLEGLHRFAVRGAGIELNQDLVDEAKNLDFAHVTQGDLRDGDPTGFDTVYANQMRIGLQIVLETLEHYRWKGDLISLWHEPIGVEYLELATNPIPLYVTKVNYS